MVFVILVQSLMKSKANIFPMAWKISSHIKHQFMIFYPVAISHELTALFLDFLMDFFFPDFNFFEDVLVDSGLPAPEALDAV
jgi:hypothetical protein